MGRRLVVSDIHGEGERLLNALELAKFDITQDELFMLGDYVDRGADSKRTIEIIMDLVKRGNGHVKAIRGNHDQMMIDAINNYVLVMEDDGMGGELSDMLMWLKNGGDKTLKDYENSIARNHVDFLGSLPLYIELEDYILVHAGIRPGVELRNQNHHDMIWIREDFHNHYKGEKTVIVGHTPVVYFWHTKEELKAFDRDEQVEIKWTPFDAGNFWAIDTGAAYGGYVTLMDLDTKEIWQA